MKKRFFPNRMRGALWPWVGYAFGLGLCGALVAQPAGNTGATPGDATGIEEILRVGDEFGSKVRRVTLDNGLRLIMLKRGDSPTLALYTKFRVGGVDETPETAGTAHLLEHMLFKGSHRIGTRDFEKEKPYLELIDTQNRRLDALRLKLEYARQAQDQKTANQLSAEIARLEKSINALDARHKDFIIKEHDALIYSYYGGVGLNAYTSMDVTNYQIQLPNNQLRLWAAIESDRLQNAVLREFYAERAVVQEERRMRYDSIASRKLFELYMQTAYASHPYRFPTIGYESNIGYLDREETERFFRQHYAPNNMVIAIVGDLDFEATESIVREAFGKIPSQKLPTEQRVREEKQKGRREATLRFAGGRRMILGWHKPAYPHPDNIAFELLSALLTAGRNSVLERVLVHEKQSCLSVNAWNGAPGERYNNQFLIFATPLGAHGYQEIERQIEEQIAKIKAGQIDQALLERLRKKMAIDFFHRLSENDSLADSLSYYESVFGDWQLLFSFYRDLQAVDAARISAIANTWLAGDNKTVATVEPPTADTAKKIK